MSRSAPRSLRIGVQLLLIAVVAGVVLLYVPPIGEVSFKTLQYSLAREAGGSLAGGRDCTQRLEGGVLRCFISDDRGGADYELTRRGRRCWDATKLPAPGASDRLRATASGCATVRDQVRLF